MPLAGIVRIGRHEVRLPHEETKPGQSPMDADIKLNEPSELGIDLIDWQKMWLTLPPPPPPVADPFESILQDQNYTLEFAVKNPSFNRTLCQHSLKLAQFLTDHYDELASKSLNLAKSGNFNSSTQFRLAFSRFSEEFPEKVVHIPKFFSSINEILSSDNPSSTDIITISRSLRPIFNSDNELLVTTATKSFTQFPKFLQMIYNSSVYESLYQITKSLSPPFVSFLEYSSTVDQIFEIIRSPQAPIERCLTLIERITSKVPRKSSLIDELASTEHLNFIYSLISTSPSHSVIGGALRVLLELYNQIIYNFDDDEGAFYDSLTEVTKGSIEEHVPDYCLVVEAERPFLDDKQAACCLIEQIIIQNKQFSFEIKALLKYLFNEMLSCPYNSILHCSFIALFACVPQDEEHILEIEKELCIKQRIIEAFKNRKDASYWGHLLKLSQVISNYDESEGDWADFVKENVDPFFALIKEDKYGLNSNSESDGFDSFGEDGGADPMRE